MKEAIQRSKQDYLMRYPLMSMDGCADPVFKKVKADALDQRVKTLFKNRSWKRDGQNEFNQ